MDFRRVLFRSLRSVCGVLFDWAKIRSTKSAPGKWSFDLSMVLLLCVKSDTASLPRSSEVLVFDIVFMGKVTNITFQESLIKSSFGWWRHKPKEMAREAKN